MNFTYPEEVLFIDDEPINNLISASLMKKYYPETRVQSRCSALEALDYMERERAGDRPLPAYIFLDLHMPLMDGWDFLQAYIERDFPMKNSTRVIILSSSVFKNDMEKASAFLVVTGFISKPLNIEHLRRLFHD